LLILSVWHGHVVCNEVACCMLHASCCMLR
jgi:hypothetical protein